MIKKISTNVFWLLFFGFFIYKILPKYEYLIDGIPSFMEKDTLFKKIIFCLHIFSGILVYCTAVLQFTPSIRNKYILFHRRSGKLYIVASLVCITALYFMIPQGLCTPCRPSHYIVTSLWLLFVFLAYYFIRQRKIVQHQHMMIRSFICAAYFVTVRVIDQFGMGPFNAAFKDESRALLASDIFVWLVPLIAFEFYWRFILSKNRLTP
ncbi:MAG: DUF2306 domain-containing protein [Saprospiraceae bacterium]